MIKTRNFCIIAHIDHGKSTLADRLIQHCGGVDARKFRDQLLDNMDIERERGITIKSNTVSLNYKARDGETYQLNLIDTPGHVDFSHEVRRSLMSCEGALLLVDASQGVEAQTVANMYLALEYELELIPVVNKIDLPSTDIDRVKEEIEADLGLDPDDAVLCSAKAGTGIEDVLEAIIAKLPAPEGDADAPLQALLFDAVYDAYRGVVLYVRIKQGRLAAKTRMRLMNTGHEYDVEEVGLLQLGRVPMKELTAGTVGYALAGIKTVRDIAVGDTLTDAARPAAEPLPGYQEAKPVVFSSIYPMSTEDYQELVKALDKLVLNDAALHFEKDSSAALGHGFRCGFLGLLHLEVVQERLEREYGLSLLLSAPSVRYKVFLQNGEQVWIDNPTYYPDPSTIASTEEPFIKASVLIPERYIGSVMELCLERRGVDAQINYLAVGRVEVTAEMPLAEVLFDFYDKLKSVTQGYGSFDYEMIDYRETDLVKVDILVNHEPVDALSQLTHRAKSRQRAMHYCERLSDTIPKHQFKIAIQGTIGGSIIARTNISALRKDVTAKCYGGDISRKRKLLEKRKDGKKRMKPVGGVEIRQAALVAVLKTDARLPRADAGLYLHIPFCARVCPYCDFAVRTGDAARRRRFVDHLIAEIALYDGYDLRFDTIYFGGGTPSLIEPEDLARIIDAARKHLTFAADTRLFLEANPEDASTERLREWKALGVATLSLGVQSFDDAALEFLGRCHGAAAATAAIERAQETGFATVSIDLMYGLPDHAGDMRSERAWRAQLECAIALGVDHLSCYQLTVHTGTRFGLLHKRGRLIEMPQDHQADIFRLTHRYLEDHGLAGYEVSQFARDPAHHSRHNTKYWNHTPYLGLGPSAHSYRDDRRWWNVRRTDPYQEQVASGRAPVAETERLDVSALVLETLMTGFRTHAGVDLEAIRRRFGVDLHGPNTDRIEQLARNGLIEAHGSRLVPTLDGLALADTLALRLEIPA